VIQDVASPIENAIKFFNFFIESIPLRPFWMCPTQSYGDERFTLFDVEPNKLYINFGFWGVMPSNKEPGFYNRLIEKKVKELGGIKSLYSSVYYSEEEFWSIFNKKKYMQLKEKYDPQHKFLNLYEKIIAK
jgi:FAD/FMN-containing dehydrogenase